ncbi:vacuolar protein sorting-associated protein 33A-like isoform X4 [Mya arenaria]|uniref:vacuolar protein sorting-associated protein 33A-like isoform X3 n=1 Tax=Mya arenaria TaxID=6604 RepID=UPI0022E31339|nr:vacuolar protein sorting-associated protein 33A-like isoform X3 [Mya arenaria]XP_052800545.1 vacuolar protein sorting-associated protein 33A-like isoform X4 [Mya arenaria]
MAGSGNHLGNGKLNLGSLRDYYRRELLECLDKCNGTKALVWDDALTGPFGLIVEYSLLKEHDVEKMMSLPKDNQALAPSSVQNIIFVTRPKLDLMDQIAQSLLKEDTKGGFRKEYHIIFVPRKSLLCERRLKEAGVHGSVTHIEEFSLSMIPFDSDLMSMEMDNSFRECFLENDMTSMFHAAQSLITIQSLYGIIPNIDGKGECAKHVVDMMMRLRRELEGQEPQITPQIDNLFIIDRTVDLLTPLLTQLTYEGLIDEMYGINNTSAKFPPQKFLSKNESSTSDMEYKTVVLNSGDELFSELRDKNFSAVGQVVSRKAKFITAEFDERNSAKTVGELKHFVSKLPHLQQARTELAKHTSIAELIKEATDTEEFMECLHCQQDLYKGEDTDKVCPYLEDCIGRREPLLKILRLLCIQSFCNNGLKPKVLDYYKREILQTYGFQHLVTLGNLEKVGLLRPHGIRNYITLRKTLKLTVDTVNEMNPNDISYVYSGYAPLSVRLIKFLARPGWRSITEVLNMLPGPTFNEVQQIPVALRKRRSSVTSSHSSIADQKVTLVFFLGGVTFAEIAALRFLAQQDDGGSDYIIATTKIITGSSLLHDISAKGLKGHITDGPYVHN